MGSGNTASTLKKMGMEWVAGSTTCVILWALFCRPGTAPNMSSFLFTSESVSEGHPDKVADQISDAILDAILAQDKRSRVAAETLVTGNLGGRSQAIARGVEEGKGLDLDQGAGDQGLMFGYACDETPQFMPVPIYLAHRLVQRQSEVRRDGRLPWLRPDAKSQVTIRYVDGKPDSIEPVLISPQHAPGR